MATDTVAAAFAADADAQEPEAPDDEVSSGGTAVAEVSRVAAPGSEAPSDELDLIARARAGDGAAFSILIGRYEGKIFRLAMNITQNREDAEDVLQEAFVKAWEHLDQFQGNSKFYTWAVRIAVNQALMKLRKRKSDRTISLDEQIDTGEDMVIREVAAWDPDPEQRYSRDEINGILTEAIDGLLPIYRTVFTLRDVDGLSTEETAEALDLTVPAVKSRLLRARLQLRDKLTRFFKRKGDDAFAYM
jgi:RNA polymerase sigma-70 factor (ECF subfamily)